MNDTGTPQNMADDLLDMDAANRIAAINPRQSFIIEAPAGAGKTELLTQRFLALLATVNDPEEIIALTFTNKAAAEMRHRVVSSLKRAAAGVAPTEAHKFITYELGKEVLRRDAEREWHLLEHAGRLQITTLDALCGKLARQMPLLSRLGSQPAIVTDPEPHYARAVQATLQAVEGDNWQAESIARVISYLGGDTQRFQSLMKAMLASRDQWLRHTRTGIDLTAAEDVLTALISPDLRRLFDVVPYFLQQELMPIARHAASLALTAQANGKELGKAELHVTALENWDTFLEADPQDLTRWRGLAELLVTQEGKLRSRLPSIPGFSASVQGKKLKTLLAENFSEMAAPVLHRVRELPSPAYTQNESRLIEDLLEVLQVAVGHLWLSFKAAGEVDFTEMAQNALLALGGEDAPSDLQLQLDYRISHLLVDEFQDTSPTQVELLRKLTAEWSHQDGRTLFLVGDPMQSIYRFRKADVGLFLKIKQNGLGNIPLHARNLYRNNRSHEELVDWGNQVFAGVFSGCNDFHRGAVRFSPAKATKGPHPHAGVTWHPIIDTADDVSDSENEEMETAAEQEARAVIDIVRRSQAENPQGTIAILVRARSHLSALIGALRKHEPVLMFQAVEIEELADRQVIQDLLSLTHALLHRGDRTHWLAILRAPWCGLLLEDMHRLVADDHRSTVWALMHQESRVQTLSADGQVRLAHVRDVLTEAIAHQGRQRIRRWVEGTWQNLGGPLCLTSEADLLDAQAFFEVVDRLDGNGALDLHRLAVEVSKMYAAPNPNASPKLQIMTIHKSKGLEFDTVILPGLHRKPPSEDRKLLLWDEVLDSNGQEQLVVAPMPTTTHGAKISEPCKFDLLQQFETERALNELQRVLYVAITRAKRTLHLLGCTKVDFKQNPASLKPPAKGSLLSLLWHVGESEFAETYQQMLEHEESITKISNEIQKLIPAEFNHLLVRLAHPKRPQAQNDLQGSPQNTEPTPLFDMENYDEVADMDQWSADVGTLIHRYLEIIARDGLDGWSVERVQSLHCVMERWLSQKGHSLEKAHSGATKVVEHMSTTLMSDRGRWLLGPHEDAGCEVAFTTVENGEFRGHIIDRMFVENGVRWIVDYKTTSQEVTDQQLVTYGEQLNRYRKLFGETTTNRCAIWLTETGCLIEIP